MSITSFNCDLIQASLLSLYMLKIWTISFIELCQHDEPSCLTHEWPEIGNDKSVFLFTDHQSFEKIKNMWDLYRDMGKRDLLRYLLCFVSVILQSHSKVWISARTCGNTRTAFLKGRWIWSDFIRESHASVCVNRRHCFWEFVCM